MTKDIKFSKLEQFTLDNQDMTFETMASQLNRTIGQCERASDRAELKLKKQRALANVRTMIANYAASH